MNQLKIVLDVQHMGKPHKPKDRGAVFEGLVESDLCLKYASFAYLALTKLGHHPFLLTSGYYSQRAAFANQIEADLYLACHLNSFQPAPKNNYSLVEATELAGQTTRAFADHIANIFQNRLPVSSSRVNYIKKDERGWSCINRVKAPAVLLEPCFINHPDSQKLLTSEICQIGQCIVSAVQLFNWEK